MEVTPCAGCGLVTGRAEGPTHAYIGASPGCWARFGELHLAGAAPTSGQLLVDTYAVQHPGIRERRAVQSVCVHLISLCAALERGWPPERGPDLLRRAVGAGRDWPWLDPPLPVGRITVDDVLRADGRERGRVADGWAADVWSAYRPHHARVRGWVDDLLRAEPRSGGR